MIEHDDPRIPAGIPHRRIVGGIPCPDILLSGDDVSMEPRAQAALAASFLSIPGVMLRRIDEVSRKTGMARISMEIDGWSPSLHTISIQYMRDVPLVDGEVTSDGIRKAYHDALIEQSARSAAGIHMGLYAPLTMDTPKRSGYAGGGKPPYLEMRHLLVDASLPAVIAADSEDPVRTLKRVVRNLHTQAEDWQGGSFVADGVGLVMECGLGRLVGSETHIDMPRGHSATFNGLSLGIHGTAIPESVLEQAVGRPLRDIVAVHPALDSRIVRSASGVTGPGSGIDVTFEPQLIVFDDVEEAARRWKR